MTINVSLGQVRINPEATFVFPQSRCCNCAATSGISTQDQNTKVTRYFLFAGTEITFEFPLPVCRDCSESLERRVPTLFHKFLVVAVITAAVFAILVMALSQISSRVPFITNNMFVSSVVISLILVFSFYSRCRPKGNQTSFYQPVRISNLDREFVSGSIRKIAFGFTNPAYLREFSQVNAQALKAGLVSASKSS
jgi:hypothetical protein